MQYLHRHIMMDLTKVFKQFQNLCINCSVLSLLVRTGPWAASGGEEEEEGDVDGVGHGVQRHPQHPTPPHLKYLVTMQCKIIYHLVDVESSVHPIHKAENDGRHKEQSA